MCKHRCCHATGSDLMVAIWALVSPRRLAWWDIPSSLPIMRATTALCLVVPRAIYPHLWARGYSMHSILIRRHRCCARPDIDICCAAERCRPSSSFPPLA